MDNGNKPSVSGNLFWVIFLGIGGYYCYLLEDETSKLGGLILLGIATLILLCLLFQLTILLFRVASRGAWHGIKIMITGAATGSNLLRFYAYRKLICAAFALLVGGVGLTVVTQCLSSSRQWVASFVVGAAFLIFKAPDLFERVQAASWYQPQIDTGGKPSEGFASNFMHRKKVMSLPQIWHATSGYLTHKRFLGDTVGEATGTPQPVWLDDYACEMIIGCIGSGKSVTDNNIAGAINRNSKVIISTKAELADMHGGRWAADPRWFDDPCFDRKGRHPGIDARGLTKVKYHVPGSRAFVVDPENLSAYPDCGWPCLHEIDPSKPEEAGALISAIGMALAVENERSAEPFWQKNTRKFIKSGIAHFVTTFPKHTWTLPNVADFLLGVDPSTGKASPDRAQLHLKMMMANDSFGRMITTGAVQVYQLGEKAFGAINAGMGDAFEWVLTPMMRKHFSLPATWSYREFGDTESTTTFIVSPSVDVDARNGFMRLHSAVSTTLFAQRKSLPQDAILVFCDEFPQWGLGSGIEDKSLVLREKRVKPLLYGQSEAAMRAALGEKFEAFASSSTERFYSVNDPETARRVMEYLGERIANDSRTYPVASLQDIMSKLLDVSSPLQFVKPYSGPCMWLTRRGFKTIRDPRTGLYVKGLPLKGHYDEHLAKVK